MSYCNSVPYYIICLSPPQPGFWRWCKSSEGKYKIKTTTKTQGFTSNHRACLCGLICMTGPLWKLGILTKPISVSCVCNSCCYKACCIEKPAVRGSLSGSKGWGALVGAVSISLFSLTFFLDSGHMLCHSH